VQAVEDGVLTVEARQPERVSLDYTLPPYLLITARNNNAWPIKLDFLSSVVRVNGREQAVFTTWVGVLDPKWNTLGPGDGFTWECGLPEGIWKVPGVKKIQWFAGGHVSRRIEVSWEARPPGQKSMLAALVEASTCKANIAIVLGAAALFVWGCRRGGGKMGRARSGRGCNSPGD
jgi:hypothetical protein